MAGDHRDRSTAPALSARAAADLILAAVAAIEAGSVCSYGDVAARAGLPGRARLVARTLANLPAGHALPWHRVVRAGARIAFAPGSADFERQAERLRAEGVKVADNGKVTARVQPLDTSLDATLWSSFFGDAQP
jgi:methylated-DNA-protein-cysteine methyltransferase-like protein